MESSTTDNDEKIPGARSTFNSEKTEFYNEVFLSPRLKVDTKDDVVAKNIDLTKQLSLPIAKVTQWLILKTIRDEFEKEEAELFKQSQEPIFDLYGRATYIYCNFLD